MRRETIYVLHKNGVKSHYIGLEYLLNDKNINLKYYEFSLLSKFYKGIVKGNISLVKKQFFNLLFLISLKFTKNKKVVFAIAPFDTKLNKIMKILNGHYIYYHTSWTCWDKTFHPKTKKNSKKVYANWKHFLENAATHIFAVTNKSKSEILKNYNLAPNKISVVYHALDINFIDNERGKRNKNSYIYVGRLTPEKGVKEILECFSQNKNMKLSIIGKGRLKELCKQYSEKYDNIAYASYFTNKAQLAKEFSKHQFMILNAKRTSHWEELFGMIIIEAMSQGTIPIAPEHSGPKEIINNTIGYLFEENKISSLLLEFSKNNKFSEDMSKRAEEASTKYLVSNISLNWRPILE